MKTEKELNNLKEEIENLNKKLVELSEDELKQVTGGAGVVESGENKGLGPGENLDEEILENLTDNVGADED